MRVCVFEFLALTLGLFTVRDAEKWVSLKFFSQREVDFLPSHQNKLFCVRRESFLIEDLFSVTSPWLIEYQALLRLKMHLWWGFLCSFDLSLEKENIQVIHAEPRLSVVFYLLTQMEGWKRGRLLTERAFITLFSLHVLPGDWNKNRAARMQQLWQSGHSQLRVGSQSWKQDSAAG